MKQTGVYEHTKIQDCIRYARRRTTSVRWDETSKGTTEVSLGCAGLQDREGGDACMPSLEANHRFCGKALKTCGCCLCGPEAQYWIVDSPMLRVPRSKPKDTVSTPTLLGEDAMQGYCARLKKRLCGMRGATMGWAEEHNAIIVGTGCDADLRCVFRGDDATFAARAKVWSGWRARWGLGRRSR